jgi:poly(A) polymerase
VKRKTLSLRDAAVAIVRRLQQHGHTAYLAGGCVRDMLLGLEPHDYDVATDAPPPRIAELFSRTRKVGAQFGVVLVRQGRHWIETATFRADLGYSDGRHPDAVRFTTAEEDARRRDFTINGMFYDPVAGRVIDYVGGEADLNARVLRAIGEPRHRFDEDHLRVLRAVRFAAVYECTIDPTTWDAVCAMAPSIRGVSAERIREELEKGWARPQRARMTQLLHESGLIDHLWEGAAWRTEQVELALRVIPHLADDAAFEQVFAVLLLNRQVDDVHAICRALTCSNKSREHVAFLVRNREVLAEPDKLTLADLKLLMQSPHFADLVTQFEAVCHVEARPLAAVEAVRRRAAAIPRQAVRPEPFVNGETLLGLGLEEGPAFKRILDAVYYKQLNDELRTKADAERLAVALVREERAGGG